MKIWISKTQDNHPTADYSEAYVFTLSDNGYSTIFTNITNLWHRLGALRHQSIFEDLFIIALSIFAIDKRVPRSLYKDCWTRNINVSIPVIEVDKWKPIECLWNEILNYLTGDLWSITFRKTEDFYFIRNRYCNGKSKIDLSGCDAVSLFSGGLDSFCGVISLLENGHKPCLFGHNEYPRLRNLQEQLVSLLCDEYKTQPIKFMSFTANSRVPIGISNKIGGVENTSRSRSLLFICGALSIASFLGNTTPVYIPENGFIGLNIPLTSSRRGSCSTRTTHPFFIRSLREILLSVDVNNPVINFYEYVTKREIVDEVKHTSSFQKGYARTISCAHPCNPRYNKTGSKIYPKNCGYCYPCIIRRCSLLDIAELNDDYSHDVVYNTFLHQFSGSDKVNDLSAIISSIHRYKRIDDIEISKLIRSTGYLTHDDVVKYTRVYKDTMNDLIKMFSKDHEMKVHIGL